jgi:phosphatidylglycerophosphatase A
MFVQSMAICIVLFQLANMRWIAWAGLVKVAAVWLAVVVTVLSGLAYIGKARRLLASDEAGPDPAPPPPERGNPHADSDPDPAARRWAPAMIVTGFGTGYLPIAPGTWGSAAVVVIYLAAAAIFAGNQLAVSGVMAAVLLLSCWGCVAFGRFAERRYGRKDPRQCTIDEWAGQALTLMCVPLTSTWYDWVIAAGVGFFSFRLFDILKPAPARSLERLREGWGVLVDDLVAGGYAAVVSVLAVLCAQGRLF